MKKIKTEYNQNLAETIKFLIEQHARLNDLQLQLLKASFDKSVDQTKINEKINETNALEDQLESTLLELSALNKQ